MQIIVDAKKDLEEFRNDYNGYQKKVDNLSTAMGFAGDCCFKSSFMPTYYAGDLEKKDMIVIIGANPGWNDNGNITEETLKKRDYFGFLNNFFTEFYNNGLRSPYYEYSNRIWGLIQNLTGEQVQNREGKYNVLQNHVINIDVIPYHSKKFCTPANTPDAKIYLNKFKCNLEKYIKELHSPRLLIFNTAITKTLLNLNINSNNCLTFTRNNNRVNKMYMFDYNGVRSVYFDAQLGSLANPTTSKDMQDAASFIRAAEQKQP